MFIIYNETLFYFLLYNVVIFPLVTALIALSILNIVVEFVTFVSVFCDFLFASPNSLQNRNPIFLSLSNNPT